MWMSELITQRGIGNGMSLLIFASIVSRFPQAIVQSFTFKSGVFTLLLFVITLRRDRGDRHDGARAAPHPGAVRQARGGPQGLRRLGHVHPAQDQRRQRRADHLRLGDPVLPAADRHDHRQPDRSSTSATPLARGPVNWIAEFVLIVFFTYFYTALVFNPIDLADNLRKNGGFIPGVRPGSATVRYIENVLNRITLPGALFLGVIAVVPTMMFTVTNDALVRQFGGTSILIMVGVALETMTQLESQLKMRHYDGFFKS